MTKLWGNAFRSVLVVTPTLVLVTALSACGGESSSPGTAQPGATTTSTAPESSDATLTVETQVRPGKDGIFYTEGALPEVTLIDADGGKHGAKPHVGKFIFPHLEPGTYSIEAALRPCDGNCGYLDPPVDGCTSTEDITDDATVRVTFRINHPCRVSA